MCPRSLVTSGFSTVAYPSLAMVRLQSSGACRSSIALFGICAMDQFHAPSPQRSRNCGTVREPSLVASVSVCSTLVSSITGTAVAPAAIVPATTRDASAEIHTNGRTFSAEGTRISFVGRQRSAMHSIGGGWATVAIVVARMTGPRITSDASPFRVRPPSKLRQQRAATHP